MGLHGCQVTVGAPLSQLSLGGSDAKAAAKAARDAAFKQSSGLGGADVAPGAAGEEDDEDIVIDMNDMIGNGDEFGDKDDDDDEEELSDEDLGDEDDEDEEGDENEDDAEDEDDDDDEEEEEEELAPAVAVATAEGVKAKEDLRSFSLSKRPVATLVKLATVRGRCGSMPLDAGEVRPPSDLSCARCRAAVPRGDFFRAGTAQALSVQHHAQNPFETFRPFLFLFFHI